MTTISRSPRRPQAGPLWRVRTELQALALSILDRPRTSVSNTFIFSTRQVRAVSVASPTFSNTPLVWGTKGTGRIEQPEATPSRSYLVVVQRRVVTQSADGGQLHQRVELGALDPFTIVEPETDHHQHPPSMWESVVMAQSSEHSHFSIRGVGGASDSELLQGTLIPCCFIDDEHLKTDKHGARSPAV